MTDRAARVCPRCGEAAGEQRFCGGCGLNLAQQEEIPTRAEWEREHLSQPATGTPVQRSGAGDSAAGDPDSAGLPATTADAQPRHQDTTPPLASSSVSRDRGAGNDEDADSARPPTPDAARDDAARSARRWPFVAAISVLVTVVAIVVIVAARGSDHGASSLAEAMVKSSQFSTLGNVSGVHCSYVGTTPNAPSSRAAFSCAWSQGSHADRSSWELYEGLPARISEGGEGSGPPSSGEEVSKLVSAVYEKRGNGTAKCAKVLAMIIDGKELEPEPNMYSCTLIGSEGVPLTAEGKPLSEKWTWHPDGSVASEVFAPGTEYKLQSATETSSVPPTATEPGQLAQQTTTVPVSPNTAYVFLPEAGVSANGGVECSFFYDFIPHEHGASLAAQRSATCESYATARYKPDDYTPGKSGCPSPGSQIVLGIAGSPKAVEYCQPMVYPGTPTKVLKPGQSLVAGSLTCTAVSAESIRCRSERHEFLVSASRWSRK